jgi:hypothetical protein
MDAPHEGMQQQGAGWLVRSSTGVGAYFVQWDAQIMRCTCPDFGYRKAAQGQACKHLRLVGKAPATGKKARWRWIKRRAWKDGARVGRLGSSPLRLLAEC